MKRIHIKRTHEPTLFIKELKDAIDIMNVKNDPKPFFNRAYENIQPEKGEVFPMEVVEPEVKPEVKPEVIPEVIPEVKPEVKPEVIPEVKPEVIPEVKPEVKPIIEKESIRFDAPRHIIREVFNPTNNEENHTVQLFDSIKPYEVCIFKIKPKDFRPIRNILSANIIFSSVANVQCSIVQDAENSNCFSLFVKNNEDKELKDIKIAYHITF